MLYSEKIASDPLYLDAYLSHCDHTFAQSDEMNTYPSRPLVVQVCGNDPNILAAAVAAICERGSIDAIDLNLGCPQTRAMEGRYGSYLLDKCHWPLVFDCVRAMSTECAKWNIPLFCKVRLIEGHDLVQLTKDFCRYVILNQMTIY
jgi:tRNA-dihydrouridine synthase 1